MPTIYTRTELQEQIDTLLTEDPETQVTRSQLNTLLSNILVSVTLQGDPANTVEIAGVNITDPAAGVKVSDVKVVGEQQLAIDPLSAGLISIGDLGIDVVVGNIADKVNSLIAISETHGLIATHSV